MRALASQHGISLFFSALVAGSGNKAGNVAQPGDTMYVHDNWSEGMNASRCDNVVIENNSSANHSRVRIYLDSTRNARGARGYM